VGAENVIRTLWVPKTSSGRVGAENVIRASSQGGCDPEPLDALSLDEVHQPGSTLGGSDSEGNVRSSITWECRSRLLVVLGRSSRSIEWMDFRHSSVHRPAGSACSLVAASRQ